MSVELRHLRSFVPVAEEIHFTLAAARVHMALTLRDASLGPAA